MYCAGVLTFDGGFMDHKKVKAAGAFPVSMATVASAALVTWAPQWCGSEITLAIAIAPNLFFVIGFLPKSLPKPDSDERAERNSTGRRQVSAARAINSSSPHPFIEQRQFGLLGAIVEFLLRH